MNNKFLIILVFMSSLALGVDYNEKLLVAARTGDLGGVEVALNNGADIEAKDQKTGETALFLAVEGNATELVRFLVEKGANANAKDYFQRSMLQEAVNHGNFRVVEALLSDSNVLVGKNDLDLAVKKYLKYKTGSQEQQKTSVGKIIAMLIRKMVELSSGALITANDFNLAIFIGDLELVKFLLGKGANVNGKDNKGDSPLRAAINNINPEIVKLLLSRSNIIITKNDLDYAKNKALYFKQQIAANEALGKEKLVTIYKVDKAKIDEIGRMLIQHLGLYTGQSGISRQGITGVHNLPPEIAAYIATFMHSEKPEGAAAVNKD